MKGKLRARYPDVGSADEIESLFAHSSAGYLYDDVVVPATEWPTNDHSIKTLAKYLGFNRRDKNHPEPLPSSGTAGGSKPKIKLPSSGVSTIMRTTDLNAPLVKARALRPRLIP